MAVKVRRAIDAGRTRMFIAINTPAIISSAEPAITSTVGNGNPNIASIEAATPAKGPHKAKSLEAMTEPLPASISANLNSADIMKVVTIAIRPVRKITLDVTNACLEEAIEGGE